jgi:pSer/pThr/pTyr-binding forkhead associated (FHA) protein
MLCPTCGQTATEGSRFCMHCGSPITAAVADDKTVAEDLEATALESSGDLYETTVMISPGSPSSKSEKPKKNQKPLFFAWLVSLEGPEKGKDHRVSKERISIGKQENSDIVIKRDFISRSHALLLYENHQFILSDLHSTNHTYVNGEMISKKTLKDNDIIKFGDAVYKFKCF